METGPDEELTLTRFTLRVIGTNDFLTSQPNPKGKPVYRVKTLKEGLWPAAYSTARGAKIAGTAWIKAKLIQRCHLDFEIVPIHLTAPIQKVST